MQSYPRSKLFGAAFLLALPWTVTCGGPTDVDRDAAGHADATADVAVSADAVSDVPTFLDVTAPGDVSLRDSPTREPCVAQPLTSDNRDIDVLFVVSTSASMATIDGEASSDSRASSVTKAVGTFMAGINGQAYGAGLLAYPLLEPDDGGIPVEACASVAYERPTVPVVALDASGVQAAVFQAELSRRTPRGGNPMAAALTGALKEAARVRRTTGHVVVTVLVTDGSADPCGANVAGAAAAAGQAFEGDHLETYVIGMGPDATKLDSIAAAGGTFHAYSAMGNEGSIAALSTVGTTWRRCHFYFPSDLPSNAFVRMIFAIDYQKPGEEILFLLLKGGDCSERGGWFVDTTPVPTSGTLCPSTCDMLLQRPERDTNAVIGCFSSRGP